MTKIDRVLKEMQKDCVNEASAFLADTPKYDLLKWFTWLKKAYLSSPDTLRLMRTVDKLPDPQVKSLAKELEKFHDKS